MSSKPKDRHHIIPRSRCKELGINPRFEHNVIRVSTSKHRAWHTLFGNKTPGEAIAAIEAEWSLSEAGQAEFKRLTENVRLFRKTK
ncbi:hypothetical protein BH10ACI1_BH10ACI1_15930 [soil metagenome]